MRPTTAMRGRITRSGRVLEDTFFKKAKAAGYVARSAYKLLEIQEKHRLIKRGARVLDLGCFPGAWLQVACQSLGPRRSGGMVLGIDIQEAQVPPRYCDDRVSVLTADARLLDPGTWALHAPTGFDVVLSDMCHSTHGNKAMDSYKSLELAETALGIAVHTDAGVLSNEESGVLCPGGHLVMKLLQGPGTPEFAQELRQHFERVAWQRPKATRKESKEVYLIGLGRRTHI